ncbi:hypothetical protein NDU88_005995 [Pleurodeles waltl]|uniref:Uncharacterized protein n=1 Tax=Pleurodeles waltl TaxID=8319 RepID=A0AAV7VQ62_PLEWA|nr:hypothetical protein NDU88_005995 [Pleurodeles waltl]
MAMPADPRAVDALYRIFQEITAVGRCLEAMDLKISDLSMAFSSIRMDIACFREKVTDLDQCLTTVEEHIKMVPEHDAELRTMHAKITDLVDRSRRDNIRFFGIPERKEGINIKAYLKSLLPKLTGLTFSPPLEFQRVTSGRPRPTIACFLRHEQAHLVLSTAQSQGPFFLESYEVRVVADFSRMTNEKRKAFLALCLQLWKMDIKFGLFEPALTMGCGIGDDQRDAPLANVQRREQQRALKDCIVKSRHENTQAPSASLCRCLEHAKMKLSSRFTSRAEYALQRLKGRHCEHGEKAGRLLAAQLCQREATLAILALYITHGSIIT